MMDQCYFPSCYHAHYCFNYQHWDDGYPSLILSTCVFNEFISEPATLHMSQAWHLPVKSKY